MFLRVLVLLNVSKLFPSINGNDMYLQEVEVEHRALSISARDNLWVDLEARIVIGSL